MTGYNPFVFQQGLEAVLSTPINVAMTQPGYWSQNKWLVMQPPYCPIWAEVITFCT
jgi:hypothetical protein